MKNLFWEYLHKSELLRENLPENSQLQKQEFEDVKRSVYNLKIESLFKSPIGKKIVSFSKKITLKSLKLNNKDWKSLENEIKHLFPEHTAQINEIITHPWSDLYRLYLLSFFNFRSKEESIILGKTDDATRQARSRIRKLLSLNNS